MSNIRESRQCEISCIECREGKSPWIAKSKVPKSDLSVKGCGKNIDGNQEVGLEAAILLKKA